MCTPVPMAASLTIARVWKQPKGPSVGKDDEMYIHATAYYLTMKIERF